MTARTVVFVHGNPETAAIWSPLVSALAERGITEVVTLSPPGFGAPAPDGFDPTMAGYAAWLVDALASLRSSGSEIDVVAHDWGAGHLYGALDLRPELIRSWVGDIAGVLHREYVWHDLAQAWQTPDVGEQAIAGMVGSSVEDKTALFESLGLPPWMAGELAVGLNETMGRCVLRLYRTGAQPAVGELGDRLAAADLPPGMIVHAALDPYVASDLSTEIADVLGAEVLHLPDRGHWWMVDDVDAIADDLVDFWSRH